MEISDLIEEAYLTWIQKQYEYMLFEVNLRLKWERLCMEQSGYIPSHKEGEPCEVS